MPELFCMPDGGSRQGGNSVKWLFSVGISLRILGVTRVLVWDNKTEKISIEHQQLRE